MCSDIKIGLMVVLNGRQILGQIIDKPHFGGVSLRLIIVAGLDIAPVAASIGVLKVKRALKGISRTPSSPSTQSALGRQQLEQTVRRLDGELRRLSRLDVELSGPGLLDRMRAAAEVYRRLEPEREAAHQETDRLFPAMLELYRGGSDNDREWVRALLRECPTFRWALGRGVGLPHPPVGLEQALQALALFSMKDGDADYRDQQLWIDGLWASLSKSGLDAAALLRQAAEWSSDTPRFPAARSTRALLLQYARRPAN